MAHTPGPWMQGLIGIQREKDEQAALERVRAAAPELLEACKSAVEALDDMHPLTAKVVQAAIDKAEGRKHNSNTEA